MQFKSNEKGGDNMKAEIVLGEAGERLLKICGGNQVALSHLIERMISRMTMGEVSQMIDVLKLDVDSDI